MQFPCDYAQGPGSMAVAEGTVWRGPRAASFRKLPSAWLAIVGAVLFGGVLVWCGADMRQGYLMGSLS